jgi:hypothetical protein
MRPHIKVKVKDDRICSVSIVASICILLPKGILRIYNIFQQAKGDSW